MTTTNRRSRYSVTYVSLSGATLTDVVLAADEAEAIFGAAELLAVDRILSVTPAAASRPRKARKVADLGLGSNGAPMFETIAEFAFAVEVAAGADRGQLFA